MKRSILDKIPKKVIKTDREELTLYRLGIFEGGAYELVELHEGRYYPPHIHHDSKSKLYTILGEGTIILGDKEKPYRVGDSFVIGKGMEHGFRVKTKTLFLSINTPPIIDNETYEIDFEYT